MTGRSAAVAGIDIGNSSTEVVLLRPGDDGGEVLAHARALTRGVKGSHDSVTAAARLTLRTAQRHGLTLVAGAVAPLRPVRTGCHTVPDPVPQTAPLYVLLRRAVTAAGDAAVVGRPLMIGDLASAPGDGPVVVLADERHGYAEVADLVGRAMRRGVSVAGVLTTRDEAVLVSNRLPSRVPVLDQVPVAGARAARLVAMEARPHGQPLRRLTDPFWVAATFDLAADDVAVTEVCRDLADSSYAVVALDPDRSEAASIGPTAEEEVVQWRDGSRTALSQALLRLQTESPGSVAGITSGAGEHEGADDAFAVHLAEIAAAANSRRGTVRVDQVVTALLRREGDDVEPAGLLERLLEVPVKAAESEVAAGRAGALSTPGVPADALVVDLGGGTVDVSDGHDRSVAAGAGELLTRVTAEGLGIPTGTAEYAKRGPALHAVAPQVVLDEKGVRGFREEPVPASVVDAICVQGPVGLVPVSRELGLGEWRSWRLSAKQLCVGRNVRRALGRLRLGGSVSLVLVGGAAGDDEMVSAIVESLPAGATVGRGNVAGELGHRCAVAYGLAAGGGVC